MLVHTVDERGNMENPQVFGLNNWVNIYDVMGKIEKNEFGTWVEIRSG